MKQIILSKGICTASYLSRIEKNQVVAGEDILSLLLKRLNLNLNDIVEKKNKKNELLISKLLSTYQDVVTNRNADYAQSKIDELLKESKLYEDIELYYTFHLILTRFKLIVGKDFSTVEKNIDFIQLEFKSLNRRQKCILFTNEGILYYKKGEIKKAILKFKEVIDIHPPREIWEEAELNFMIGLAYIADGRITQSLEYTEKAFEYYKSKFMMRRVIDCYMLKGITLKKLNKLNEAKECYKESIELCKKFDIIDRLGSIYHNLGSIYLYCEQSNKGVEFILKSLKYKSKSESKLISILALVMEYYKIGNEKKVIHWSNEGLALCLVQNNVQTNEFLYHFNFYNSLFKIPCLPDNIANKTIQYFEHLEDYETAQKYSIIIGERLYMQGKYKTSSDFLMKANYFMNLNKI